jgi:hypothetical protein
MILVHLLTRDLPMYSERNSVLISLISNQACCLEDCASLSFKDILMYRYII